jgi:hypothetical protein
LDQKNWDYIRKYQVTREIFNVTATKIFLFSDDDRVIFISPQETILAHTQEFIGGRKTVTTMMKARSSLGRNFIEICKCAGRFFYLFLVCINIFRMGRYWLFSEMDNGNYE